jgi:uncharacterized membrane protein YdjX (TVP38/TMEM64 family)
MLHYRIVVAKGCRLVLLPAATIITHMKKFATWLCLLILLCLVIILPFLFWGEALEAHYIVLTGDLQRHRGWILLIQASLLAFDIVLPVPSSLVSTGCGAAGGLWWGTLASWSGMTLSCLMGYGLGRLLDRGGVMRLMGSGSHRQLERLSRRAGWWIVVITRPVPVLAEAAVLLAGMGEMPLRRFVGMTAAANLGISLLYAAIGASALSAVGFGTACMAAMGLPGLLMLVAHLYHRGRQRQDDPPPQ